jgi:hypothetical protein
MQFYLSHWDREEVAVVAEVLREHGHDVTTNMYRVGIEDPDKRADDRMRRISEADYFVFFASPKDKPQLIRSIELGYAIGCQVNVAFVGEPKNSFHRFGDIFDHAHGFLAAILENCSSKTMSAMQEV